MSESEQKREKPARQPLLNHGGSAKESGRESIGRAHPALTSTPITEVIG